MVTARMNMSFWVYILKCADGTFYTGHTENLEKRIAEHQQKLLNCYTTSRLPVELVFCSEFATRLEALASERQIKGWTRNKKKALINSDWKALVRYSKNNQ
ncbi:MAG: GIY-YIG nuclease family protein [Dehalococcoidales bacterium]|jgi:predicted GIY-YIG superfamily endonuclease|nr:GIY-YIG nuclease family protein [Dehalococcoidales bacterium]